MASEFPDIPHHMRRVYRRFQQWRSAHTGRLPIPERLWRAAVELAREHGVFRTSKVLRLEYGKLKQLVEAASPAVKRRVVKTRAAFRPAPGGKRRRSAVPRRASSIAPPAFVELLTPRSGSLPGAVVELEGPHPLRRRR